MNAAKTDTYSLFFNFIDEFAPGGFKNIDRNDPLMKKLEKVTGDNRQFFFLFDVIQLKVIFSSKRSSEMMGVEPEDLNPSDFIKSLHPDDINWSGVVQSRLLNAAREIFVDQAGSAIFSSIFRLKNSSDEYVNTLIQSYVFYAGVPYKTVFILHVLTDISWFNTSKPGYHFYLGNDPYYFRYPTEKILSTGNIFSAL
jgi:hypothetical protein